MEAHPKYHCESHSVGSSNKSLIQYFILFLKKMIQTRTDATAFSTTVYYRRLSLSSRESISTPRILSVFYLVFLLANFKRSSSSRSSRPASSDAAFPFFAAAFFSAAKRAFTAAFFFLLAAPASDFVSSSPTSSRIASSSIFVMRFSFTV